LRVSKMRPMGSWSSRRGSRGQAPAASGTDPAA